MPTEDLTNHSDGSVDAVAFLDELIDKSETLGSFIAAIREGEEMTQVEFAAKLGISKSHLCDIEKGRKLISAERAARFADILGYLPASFVELALQDLVNRAELGLHVVVTPIESRHSA